MAALLRDKIRASGLTGMELAKLTGVPQPRISVFMSGKDIRLSTAQRIADHFGLVLTKGERNETRHRGR